MQRTSASCDMGRLLACLLMGWLAAICAPQHARAEAAPGWPDVYLSDHVVGLVHPVQVTHAGDGSGRLFVVELPGRVRIVRSGQLEPTPFLDIAARSACATAGLFSVAFPPSSNSPTHVYVAYSDNGCNLVVARFSVSTNPDVVDATSEEILLTVPNILAGVAGHMGGQLAFGPDGYLYISTGDGTNGGDPGNLAQDAGRLEGKLLRIEVHVGTPGYAIPPGNPFVGMAGRRPEIWASGLRNPFRFSFDSLTGDLYVADVGQETWEEVNFQPASDPGGRNYGWRTMEGPDCYLATSCDTTGLTTPVSGYAHVAGDCDINGGEVYRGTLEPDFAGVYFAGDFCSGRIRGVRQGAGGWEGTILKDTGLAITHFGRDEAGRFHVLDYIRGAMFRLTGTPAPTDLALTMSRTPDPIGAGGRVTFSLLVNNEGPATAFDVAITDALPAALRLVSASTTLGSCRTVSGSVTCTALALAPGQSITVTLVTTALNVGVATNTAQVSADSPDTDATDNAASAISNITPVANLTLTHTDAPDPLLLGNVLNYSLVARNRGPSTATNVVLTDTLPPALALMTVTPSHGTCTSTAGTVTCALGTMATNATATVSVQAMTLAAARVTATAHLGGAEFDPVASDNTRGATSTIVGLSTVSLAATTIAGCRNSTGTVRLNSAAPAGGAIVMLSASLPSVTVPASVFVPAGSTSATFPITTAPVSVKATGSLSAQLAGVTRTASLTVRPIGVAALSLVPNTTQGGSTATANIDLECPAAPGNITVAVTSSSTATARPLVSSLVIPAGETSAQVGVSALPTTVTRTATIRATANTVTKSAVLTVTP